MNKPIEVGCLVMVIAGKHAGMTGTVIEHDPTGAFGKWEWAIDVGFWKRRTLLGCVADSSPMWAMSKNLIRIDDYDASADATEQEREVEHG